VACLDGGSTFNSALKLPLESSESLYMESYWQAVRF
jgi:hypothetical protein